MTRSYLFLLLLAACTPRQTLPVKSGQFNNQQGQIQVFVCGRGCRQFVLETGGTRYAPIGLPDDFRTDKASVVFSGELLPDSTTINTFGPDDRLIPDFKVRNLHITHIVKQ